ncbi:MAG: hypothetical protein ACE5NG_07430 [bacterium]
MGNKLVMIKVFKILTLFIMLTLISCEHDLPTPANQIEPRLSSIQENILTPRCAISGCHIPGGAGPMALRNKNESFNNLVNVPSAFGKPRVDPGNANNSVLFLKVIGDNSVGQRMPRNGPPFLNDDEINAIRDWINDGALDN